MSQSLQRDTRERIVEAGKRVIYERGFHRARVSDITSAAGVAHGTFYLYFKTKEDFLLELLLSVRNEMISLMSEGEELIRRGERERGRETVFLKTFELMVREKELAKILFFEAICTDRKFQEFYRESKALLFERTKGVLDLLGIDRSDIKAHILMGTARHLIELLILTGEEVEETWQEVLRELGVFS